MAAEEAGGVGRSPACLCVLCGLPAAGKSTLARKVLRSAPLHGWRATVVPYDDLIPEHAFQTRAEEDGGTLQEIVNTVELNWQIFLSEFSISIAHKFKVLYQYQLIVLGIMIQERKRKKFNK